jgi:hypothetical protein
MSKNAPFWPHIESTDAAGLTAVDMLGIVFFLEPKACADSSHAIRAFEAYLGDLGRQEPLAYLDDAGDMHPVPSNPLPMLKQQLIDPLQVQAPPADAEYLSDEEWSAPSVRMFLADPRQPAYRYLARYFYAALPMEQRHAGERIALFFRISQETMAAVGTQAVISFALELSEFLPYSSGYISPVLTCDDGFEAALPYAKRYPGLDVANVGSVAIDLGDRPAGAYWVNFFGPRLTQALGGPETLRAKLPAEAGVLSCGQGGFCTILGEQPDIGDVNRQNTLPLYRQLATVLSPQFKVPEVTYFTDADGFGDKEAQAAWHKRFLR